MEIEKLNFSVRTYNCLKRKGIHTVEQLERLSDEDLLRIRGFGVGCLAEVRWQIGKPIMSNADRIRAMSDEELARSISRFICDINEGVEYHESPSIWLEWLQQPAEKPTTQSEE